MIRSVIVALATIVGVSILCPVGELAAQPANVTSQSVKYPVDFTNAPPGVKIELFLNNGKLADVTVGVTGDASWVLDLGNMSKTRVQIYVDVCKDGKPSCASDKCTIECRDKTGCSNGFCCEAGSCSVAIEAGTARSCP